MFVEAFSHKEIEILDIFTENWKELDAELDENLSIDDLLANTAWAQIMEQATLTLGALSNAT